MGPHRRRQIGDVARTAGAGTVAAGQKLAALNEVR